MIDTFSNTDVQAHIARGVALADAEAAQRGRMRGMKFDTIAVHGLYSMEAALANQGSIIEPAFLSSAQHFENSDHMAAALSYQMPAWAYSRIANPTLHYLEATLAMLESYGFGGDASACVTGSGMAAIFMATNPFLAHERCAGADGGHRSGVRMNIVASAKCYGGTFMLFSQRYAAERGVEVRWVRDPLNLEEWASKIDGDTRFVYGEMPSNPSLALFDIAALADLAHQHGLPLIVDATVATPALLRPLCYGADIVVHSVSKSMASSGFAIAGALIARHYIPSRVGPDELRADFATYVKLLPFRDHGPALSPFNALMALNDLRTLRGKMDQASQSALQVARFLEQQKQVEQVDYPGLPASPSYDLATRYLRLADGADAAGRPANRFGPLLSFTVRGGAAAAR
ncbi:MAG TPA: PLP-dependent transferase, partial [Roseiflexaceae bacterium]|nr:PLP-dependent transferase [Roseiflexaceae bacterium]